MQVSVIIVNYNVRFFLEQCLCSVQRALNGLTGEVIVVDNHSPDDSLSYLIPRFPGVRFLANDRNIGFAAACNQGWAASSGSHVLFLNPDTILPEDALAVSLAFFQRHSDAGALGVRMLDGSGRFLKESKRAFPSPMTAFYKLSGLARMFPRSRVFSAYHLGHLDERKDHEVDVLSGAYMMVRRDVLQLTGGFDESYFMYGEDVDLSYRIQQTGFRNYYVAGTSILHFKGESTRMGSLNYVRLFYSAMSRFVTKHYSGARAGSFRALVQIGIWLRALLSATGHFIRRLGLPLLDAAWILLSFWLVTIFWSRYVKTQIHYDERLLQVAFPAFSFLYLLAAYYEGLYDRWYRWSRLIRATVIATLVILAGYTLLPESYRFSRGIIVFGAVLAFGFISFQRMVFIRFGVLSSDRERHEGVHTLIAADPEEYDRLLAWLEQVGLRQTVLGRLRLSGETDSNALGTIEAIHQLSRTIPVKSVIFCAGRLSYRSIIEYIDREPGRFLYRIHASGSGSVVGSHSKSLSGDTVSSEPDFRIADPYLRRLKRLTDLCVSLAGLFFFPLHLFGVRRPVPFFSNCLAVLFGRKTWVGYSGTDPALPRLRQPVLTCGGWYHASVPPVPVDTFERLDHWYAREYEPLQDLLLLWKHYRSLGG
ncbi:MAG: hypothetical protein RJA57_570 [Bacteroidota bacterium]